jgi:hypothetical protein
LTQPNTNISNHNIIGSINKIAPSVINLSNQNSPRNINDEKQTINNQNIKSNTQNNNNSVLLKSFL